MVLKLEHIKLIHITKSGNAMVEVNKSEKTYLISKKNFNALLCHKVLECEFSELNITNNDGEVTKIPCLKKLCF